MALTSVCVCLSYWKVFCLNLSYFCFDNPNSLSERISQEMTKGNDFKYNLLYSVYSYPNVILPLFGGLMVDKLGLP